MNRLMMLGKEYSKFQVRNYRKLNSSTLRASQLSNLIKKYKLNMYKKPSINGKYK